MRRSFIVSSLLVTASLAFTAQVRAVAEPVAGPPNDTTKEMFTPMEGRRAATPEELDRLNQAMLKIAKEKGRWAYTENTIVMDDKGKVKESKVVRYDPSKPYAEQYTPLEINGQPPTEKHFKEYRRRGEKRGEHLERDESAATKLNGKTVGELVDLSHAMVFKEDERSLVYELPLNKEGNDRFPPEKFQVLVSYDKLRGTIETAAVRLKEPLRAKLIVKVKSGEASVDFTTVDPKYAPAMTAVRGDASASILFINVGGKLALTRTDLKRVKPYGDRFGVEIGPAKALDF